MITTNLFIQQPSAKSNRLYKSMELCLIYDTVGKRPPFTQALCQELV